ncbi:hypothetical protein CO038_01905 [Candidatus Pacearchaeota archaeon CG_4_9_14_0_2_um_filter_39_13]|nr:NUDIX domain-containing protein [Candidatus Pacearchaeota archaeon]OIO43134.1 MAG: hypothetical protein AUJ64_03055 [Candidatus Pacearchaeota archaeon CG1_02_39_14]PJC44702.1 MAG: hypothetical protein CO038_01905 [Candidatus Pacearchaeota archaeon CG_4_9_14_0_2_um_filter_39_13]
MDFRVAVRGFVVDSGNLLVLKRLSKEHMPGIWEPPGGRLNEGEDPFLGLKREVMEEAGLDVEIGDVMSVRYFTRQDGQKILMLTFLCTPLSKEVRLSDEHSEFRWIDLNEDEGLDEFLGQDGFYRKEVEIYRRLFDGRV